MKEKYIVRVIRKREFELPPSQDSTSNAIQIREEADQVYEQEFNKFDVGEFAISLNKKREGQEKDEKSMKMDEQGEVNNN